MIPTQNNLNPKRALLLIDFQVDFLSKDGRLPVAMNQVEPMISAAKRAVEQARVNGDLMIRIGNEFRPSDRLMNLLRRNASVAGSAGAAWDPRLTVEDSVYFPKWASSAFVNPDLEEYLKRHNVQEVVLCGLQVKACVAATAKDAQRRGYQTKVLAEATACLTDVTRYFALQWLAATGVEITQLRQEQATQGAE